MGEQVSYNTSEAIETSTTGIQLYYFEKEVFDLIQQSSMPDRDRTKLFAQLARFNVLYMVASAGSGHLGSSFSSLDIVSWLYLNVLKSEDRYFSSKGHDSPGLYAIQTALGIIPFEKIHAFRKIGGLPGHPDVSTPGAHTNTGSLGMGVSKAKGFLIADDLYGNKSKGRIFVLTGDGELQEGQFWESLVTASRRRDGRLTIIVDHNKVQSDTYVSAVSDLGDLEAKFLAFGWDTVRCDGHDYLALEQLLISQAPDGRPRVIIADTIKGNGVSFMEHTSMGDEQEYYSYHSGAPSLEDYQNACEELLRDIKNRCSDNDIKLPKPNVLSIELGKASENSERMIPAYSEAILMEARRDSKIVALDADLVLDTGLIPFKEEFPERYIECGIAEQDMVSQAGTIALNGLIPVVHSFSCFLTSRASEQIYNNCTEKTKIIYVGSLAGLLPSGPGHSHQSLRDITAMSAMPGITIIEPANARQVKSALQWAVSSNSGSTYLRLTSIPYESFDSNVLGEDMVEGRGEVIFGDSNEIIIVAVGPIMTNIAISIAKKMSSQGYLIQVICTTWLNRIDIDWYKQILEGTKVIMTLENHYMERGFGSWFIGELSVANIESACRSQAIGIDSIPACGAADEVLEHHGMDDESLVERLTILCDKFSVSVKEP